ncbi:diguanylate cyclase domain-containing protein [Klenkia brasiliensis]|uniref:Diguanylate cyclase (GGDEF) domain-containing protein n=1 Tax=Klenkia brasiliensis TaxID=333142 RepID=A0A1G7MW99_9ACTN|nr:diguanylate cyclase [Klenkia brasiliensis]SDF66073.1 diguanylate cyclase (GGDEF) domain-containing protein [Klenkia brasiliensis]
MSGQLRRSALAVLLGAVVLAAALAVTPATSVGFQADNTALGLLTAVSAVRAARLARGTTGRRGTSWRLLAGSGALFSVAALVTGSGFGDSFGVAGLGDVLLLPVLVIPPLVCVRLATEVRRGRSAALLVDGAAVVLALAFVVDVLALSAPDAVRTPTPLVLAYAGYAVLAVGLAGAVLTVTTRELQRPATAMVVMSSMVALAAAMLAVGLDRPGLLWQGIGDLACLLALEAGVAAVATAPRRPSSPEDVAARSPRVNVAGLAITLVALGGVPVALLVALLRGQAVTPWSMTALAAVVGLLLVRSTIRIRTSTGLVADLVRNEEDVRALVEGSSDGVVIVDDDLRLRFTSPAARTLLGVGEDAADRDLLDLLVPADREAAGAALTAGVPTLHLRVPGDAGQPAELEVTQHQRAGQGRRVLHLRDATVRLRRERELERMAYTDHLTRLPNRALLFEELAAPAGERCLLVLDLDGFKAVNDVAGHEAGDQLLVEVARRLRTVVRDQDVVCRLGGDEFAVVVDGTVPEAVEAAQRVVDAMALPHRTADRTFALGASVGVAELRPGSGQLAFREADTALRAAKRAGKGCVRVWDGGARGDAAGSVAAALAGGEVELRYSVTGRTGQERAMHGEPSWAHPSGALLPAAELWAAAGRQGCDAELQTWVLAEATRHAASLPAITLLALDLPAGHVQAGRLVDDVHSALAASGLPPGRLSLVFTEEAVLTSTADLVPALHELRAAGVRLCLDDFGMGQTLYAHLSRVPLTSVRIDVSALGARDEQDLLLRVRAIVASADMFGLRTVAHGIGPGPLLDRVMECGVSMVRTREDLRNVPFARVQQELAAGPAGTRILAG